MLKICRVHTTLPTADLARARVFFENTLGIPPKTELPSGIFYDCGEGDEVRSVANRRQAVRRTHPDGLRCRRIDSEVQELRSRGVVFEHYDLPGLTTVEGIVHRPALKAAWFKDTDGNLLAIMQPVEPLD